MTGANGSIVVCRVSNGSHDRSCAQGTRLVAASRDNYCVHKGAGKRTHSWQLLQRDAYDADVGSESPTVLQALADSMRSISGPALSAYCSA